VRAIRINEQQFEVTDEQFQIITSPRNRDKSMQAIKDLGAKGKSIKGKKLQSKGALFKEVSYFTYDVEYDGEFQMKVFQWPED
jgi:hypothetical protein